MAGPFHNCGMISQIRDKLQGRVPQGSKRSSQWSRVRKEYLDQNPKCAVCGGVKSLEVHHKRPFHLHPELELDPSNLITLCEASKTFNCHRLIGHLNNYRGWNPDVEKDALEWSMKLGENAKRIFALHNGTSNP